MKASAAKLASLVLSFGLGIYAARNLTADESGVFLAALVVLPFLSMGGRLGTDTLAVRMGLRDARSRSQVPRLYLHCALGCAGVSILAFVFLAVDPLASYLPVSSGSAALLLATVPMHGLSVLHSGILRALGRLLWAPFLEVGLTQVITIAVAALFAGVRPIDLTTMALVYLLASGVTCGVGAWSVSRALRDSRDDAETGRPLQASLAAMLGISLSGSLHYLWAWFPLFMSVVSSGVTESGQAVAVVKYAALAATMYSIQSNALLPSVAHLARHGHLSELNRIVLRASRRGAIAVVLATLAVAVAAKPLMSAYGHGYESYSYELVVAALGLGCTQALSGFGVPIAILLGNARLLLSCFAVSAAVGLAVASMWGPNLMQILLLYVGLNALVVSAVVIWVRSRMGIRLSIL